jgi:hypothetical protein
MPTLFLRKAPKTYDGEDSLFNVAGRSGYLPAEN